MNLSEIIPKRVVYAIPGMEQAKVRSNIVYKSVDGLDLMLDVYYPPNFTNHTKLPAVLFIHGDGPAEIIKNAKDWGQYISWGQLVAASGFIAVPFNHRSSEGKLSGMVDIASDVKDLINYVQGHADELGIDQNLICVWACSAGVPYLQTVMETPPKYARCLVAYYGMMNFQQFADTMPPIFIAQAGLDNPTINETINQFVAEAIARGVKVEFIQHSEGHHGFDILDDDETSRIIIKQTLQFIQNYLQNK